MCVSAIFITDDRGKVLIHRNYRDEFDLAITEDFRKILIEEDCERLTPIFEIDGITFCFVKHNDLYILTVTEQNSNAMIMLSFLYSMIKVFTEYFYELEQESIRDNFVIIYELLDEMCDFGYPQFTDDQLLQEYICIKEKHKLNELFDSINNNINLNDKQIQNKLNKSKEITSLVTGIQHHRKNGIKYRKNEVFLDVVEKLTLIMKSNGQVIHSEIKGELQMKCYLSGIPELKLGLNDKVMMQKKSRKRRTRTVEMDDIRFHDCVQLNRFETERVISFIPPDGEFLLMSYRLDIPIKPILYVECHKEEIKNSRIHFTIKLNSEYKTRTTGNNIIINIPVPTDVSNPTFKTSIGHIEYSPENNCIQWKIKSLSGQREYLARAHFRLPSVRDNINKDNYYFKPIICQFEIPYFTVSGVQIKYLKIVEKSGYKALPWVRYITQNGDYHIKSDK